MACSTRRNYWLLRLVSDRSERINRLVLALLETENSVTTVEAEIFIVDW